MEHHDRACQMSSLFPKNPFVDTNQESPSHQTCPTQIPVTTLRCSSAHILRNNGSSQYQKELPCPCPPLLLTHTSTLSVIYRRRVLPLSERSHRHHRHNRNHGLLWRLPPLLPLVLSPLLPCANVAVTTARTRTYHTARQLLLLLWMKKYQLLLLKSKLHLPPASRIP